LNAQEKASTDGAQKESCALWRLQPLINLQHFGVVTRIVGRQYKRVDASFTIRAISDHRQPL
jgi:hypothetical protein